MEKVDQWYLLYKDGCEEYNTVTEANLVLDYGPWMGRQFVTKCENNEFVDDLGYNEDIWKN